MKRVSFLPAPAAADSPAPGAAKDAGGKADGGEGPAREAPLKPLLAAKIQKEVSAPLAGVQTALIMDVPIWEHTKTFRSLSHGLYVMPKARFRRAWRPLCSSLALIDDGKARVTCINPDAWLCSLVVGCGLVVGSMGMEHWLTSFISHRQ